MKQFRLFLISALAVSACFALAETKSADELMSAAFAKADKEHKAVVLSFHASWCGWCHKLEDFLKQPEIKKIWDRRVEMVWLTVMEDEKHKADENLGGMDWLKKNEGDGGGIPFIVMFDSKGKAVVNSNMDGKKSKNTGYPAAPEEIAWFMKMLEKGVPNMTADERGKIEAALKAEAKKIGR